MSTTPEKLPLALPHQAGWIWITESWQLFRLSIGNWISVAFTYMLLILLSAHIREAWILVLPFGLSYLAPGLMLLARKIEEDDDAQMSDLFVGFTKPYRASMFKIGAINFGGTLLTLALMLFVGMLVGIPQVGVLDTIRNLNHMMMFWAPLWPIFLSLLFGMFIINAITLFAAGHIVHGKKTFSEASSLGSLTFTMNWKPLLRMLGTLILFIMLAILALVIGILVPKLLAPLVGQAAAASLAMLLILLPVVISVVIFLQLLLIGLYRCFQSTLNKAH